MMKRSICPSPHGPGEDSDGALALLWAVVALILWLVLS